MVVNGGDRHTVNKGWVYDLIAMQAEPGALRFRSRFVVYATASLLWGFTLALHVGHLLSPSEVNDSCVNAVPSVGQM